MSMRGERRRDKQQWMLDWRVKTTGRVQNFAHDNRIVPPEVKSYRMIPRVMGKHGRRLEEMARAAEQAGHRETARELYWLRDALAGQKPPDLKREVFVREKEGLGAYSESAPGIFLPGRLGIQNGALTPAQLGPAGEGK